MTRTFSLDSLLSVFVFALTYYLAHRYWKYKALERARAWAATRNLAIIASYPATFNMSRQRPRIAFQAEDRSGQRFAITLRLKATSIFSGPLSMSASVEVLEQIEVSANAA